MYLTAGAALAALLIALPASSAPCLAQDDPGGLRLVLQIGQLDGPISLPRQVPCPEPPSLRSSSRSVGSATRSFSRPLASFERMMS